jgi:hypothetical protein
VFDRLLLQRLMDREGTGRRTWDVQGENPMTLRSAAGSLALLLASCFALTIVSRPAAAGYLFCQKATFYHPRPPCVKYKCICPKPISNCCPLPNFGYSPTCWHAWPFPPDYSHCPMPPGCQPGGIEKPHDQLPPPKAMPTPPSGK